MKLVDIGPGRRRAGELAGGGAWGVGRHDVLINLRSTELRLWRT